VKEIIQDIKEILGVPITYKHKTTYEYFISFMKNMSHGAHLLTHVHENIEISLEPG
jgi:hypothetical protein